MCRQAITRYYQDKNDKRGQDVDADPWSRRRRRVSNAEGGFHRGRRAARHYVETVPEGRGVIRGAETSHGGRGISPISPAAKGMKAAMHQAYRTSGVDPRTVSHVEVHGTAPPLGDAIEIDALLSGVQRDSRGAAARVEHKIFCYISILK